MKLLIKRQASKNRAKEWNIQLTCRDSVKKCSVKDGVSQKLAAEIEETPPYSPCAN